MDYVLFGLSAVGFVWHKKRSTADQHTPSPMVREEPVMALWFSAGWCPDCVAFRPYVESFLKYQAEQEGGPLVRFVYVSSDNSEAEMNAFQPTGMAHVPFDNREERDNMKRHYGVCAAKEREGLNMTLEQRKFGIPTVLFLEKTSGDVMYSGAAIDLERMEPPQVYQKWKSIILSQKK